MAHLMYTQPHLANQKPETFMLSTEAQQSLPHDAQVALQQVDNCKQSVLCFGVEEGWKGGWPEAKRGRHIFATTMC